MDLHRSTAIRWTSFTLLIQLVYSASVYPNKNLPSTNNNVEPLCNYQIERYVESEGKESSLTLQLHPGLSNHGTCKRILTAPESHGFIVRLVRPNDIKQQSSGSVAKNSRGITTKAATNSTRSCPLSIFSSSDPLTPSWKIDPCMLEASGDLEEPVKLFQGRLRIVYNHSGNSPNSQLLVTVLGKGVPCQQKNKHPCLRFGYEALLCISKDLVCDGVRHCPKGSEYDSDEDYEMCSKRKMEGLGNDSWEQLTIEIFRNLWNSNLTTNSTSKIGLGPVANSDKKPTTPKTSDLDGQVKRNVTRGSIAGDLSRYGPWGYLMLGMLLCGGALLICGLWECCCRQNKSGDTNITASTLPPNVTDGEQTNNTAQDSAPPNYDEIDPPPPYSILFPNQKANAAETGTTSTNNAPTDDNNSSEQSSQTSSR